MCSLHKSTCFGFVSWFFFNVQFFAFAFMFYQLKWEVKFVSNRQLAPSLTKKKATNLKRKNPTRFSLDQNKQIVDRLRVSGARKTKFAGHCKHEHAQPSKTNGLSSVCSLHKSTCFGFVSWFLFNVQFFAFTFTFYQLKWEVKFNQIS